MKRSTALAVFILALTVMAASAQTYTELMSFNGDSAAGPQTALLQGVDGNFYGTTYYGGTGTCFDGEGIGCGVIFRITRRGSFEIIHNFQDSSLAYPTNNLVLGYDGNLYGTMLAGNGIIFRVSRSGDFVTLYTFTGGVGGTVPNALVQGVDGNFYGTTIRGGAPSQFCPSGCGTFFKMTPDGTVTTLYSFCPDNYCPDGENPIGQLVQGLDGSFYGTALTGGLYKYGTAFKISADGKLRVMYAFQGIDGGNPYPGGLLLANDGNFYGTNGGTVYRITPSGVFTQLSELAGGYNPNLPVQGTDGNLYGTTQAGGTHNLGLIYDLPTDGTASLLYAFSGYPEDGGQPFSSIVQSSDGSFYGNTFTGGNSACNYYNNPGCGTLYSLDMGLPPFVTFLRGAGGPGRRFGILGQGFTGATAVSLNGTPVDFKVKADTFIAATVPAGATTGYVTVTTSGGKLKSNVPFRVLK